jgi:hypothetical protein
MRERARARAGERERRGGGGGRFDLRLLQNISMHESRRKAVSNPCHLCTGKIGLGFRF